MGDMASLQPYNHGHAQTQAEKLLVTNNGTERASSYQLLRSARMNATENVEKKRVCPFRDWWWWRRNQSGKLNNDDKSS